jgi:hypothetical protein
MPEPRADALARRASAKQWAETQLEKEIQKLMREAEIVGAQEDGKYGKGKRGSDLPEKLQRREDRLVKIRQARKELEAETAAEAAKEASLARHRGVEGSGASVSPSWH